MSWNYPGLSIVGRAAVVVCQADGSEVADQMESLETVLQAGVIMMRSGPPNEGLHQTKSARRFTAEGAAWY